MSEPRTEPGCSRCGAVTFHSECFVPDSTVPIEAVTVNGEQWARITPAEAASPAALDVRWLADELGMHQFVNDHQCDCGDWDAFRDKGTFNDHVATEVVARLAQQDGTGK